MCSSLLEDINDILGLAGNAASMGQYSTNLTTSQKTDSTPQIPGRTYQHTGRSRWVILSRYI